MSAVWLAIALEELRIRLSRISSGKVEEVPEDWVTFWPWGKWEVGSLAPDPKPAEYDMQY